MIELHLIKKSNGFIVAETTESYLFQNFLNENNEDINYKILNATQGLFGTDNGILMLTVNCAIDDVTYPTIEQFAEALYNV